MAKDLFSNQSDLYARYRPHYPKELFDYIVSFVNNRDTAWDCATGNGQAASVLADYFEQVIATDISAAQLEKAVQKNNITYSVCPAESTPFSDNTFDLVTVAQAYHWIKWKAFRKEVIRVSKPGAVIAVWMYYNHNTHDEKVGTAVRNFYETVTKPYWEYERKYVEEKYETVEFDYELLPVKQFESVLNWHREDLLGYVSSWSAIQKIIKANGYSPVPELAKELKTLWPDNEIKKVSFPVYLKLGRISKPGM
jgi:ubiquinone/menaquinone biosynthesis C-methylase UbiE